MSLCLSVSLSFRPSARNNWAHTGRVFLRSDISRFFWEFVKKTQVLLKCKMSNGNLQEDQYIFSIIFRSVFLRVKNVSDTHCRENPNTRLYSITCLSKIVPCMRWCGQYCKNGHAKDDVTRRKRIACCIPKATYTHSEHVIITAFPL
jgi:hypothetical protein